VSYGLSDPIVYSLLLVGLLLRPQGLFGARSAVRD
jgi:branched-subunit amino acid ABC-type transport system permease component